MKLEIDGVKINHDTNIMDLEVPDFLRRRHQCSVDWLDEAFMGGFVPSSVTMLTGAPGAGKTTMMLQMANGITRTGNICLYNTKEESLSQIKLVLERLGLTDGFYCGQHVLAKDLFDHANKLIKQFPKKQLFLIQDSLPTLDDGKYKDGATNSRTPGRACKLLTEWSKKTNAITCFINHVTKTGDFAGKNEVKHMIDAHAHLSIETNTKSDAFGKRNFVVTKNRFGDTSSQYVIEMTEKGLNLFLKNETKATNNNNEKVSSTASGRRKRKFRVV